MFRYHLDQLLVRRESDGYHLLNEDQRQNLAANQDTDGHGAEQPPQPPDVVPEEQVYQPQAIMGDGGSEVEQLLQSPDTEPTIPEEAIGDKGPHHTLPIGQRSPLKNLICS